MGKTSKKLCLANENPHLRRFLRHSTEAKYCKSIGNHRLDAALQYSMVPKEMHVRKESHGCSLGLCIGQKERHDSTFGQTIDPKERHVPKE